jgi:poly-D-alanine transfer protein DltD
LTAQGLEKHPAAYNARREVASKNPELVVGKHGTEELTVLHEVKSWAEDLVDKLWDVEKNIVELCSIETLAAQLTKIKSVAKVYGRILVENNKYDVSEDIWENIMKRNIQGFV